LSNISKKSDPYLSSNRRRPAQRLLSLRGVSNDAAVRQTVDWIVLAHPIAVDETDIARFGKLYPMNARPVQKRDRRFILSSSPQR
jgi:carbonic anhydrase